MQYDHSILVPKGQGHPARVLWEYHVLGMGLYADEESRNHGHAVCLGVQLEKGILERCSLPSGIWKSNVCDGKLSFT